MPIIASLIKKELTEFTRTKKTAVLIMLFLFIAISSPIIAKLIPQLLTTLPGTNIVLAIPDPTWKDAIDQYIKNISQIAVIAIIFMFSGIICDEKNKKTLEIILTKPIKRSQLLFAKYLAGSILIIFVSIFSSIIFYTYSLNVFGDFDLSKMILLTICLTAFLQLIFTITFFFSTFINNQINAAGLTFLSYVIIATVFNYIDALKNYIPTYFLGNYIKIVNGESFNNFLPSILVTIVVVILLLFVSIQMFSKQEVER